MWLSVYAAVFGRSTAYTPAEHQVKLNTRNQMTARRNHQMHVDSLLFSISQKTHPSKHLTRVKLKSSMITESNNQWMWSISFLARAEWLHFRIIEVRGEPFLVTTGPLFETKRIPFLNWAHQISQAFFSHSTTRWYFVRWIKISLQIKNHRTMFVQQNYRSTEWYNYSVWNSFFFCWLRFFYISHLFYLKRLASDSGSLFRNL